MGYNSVYKLLQELFPQVDARALRAAAIEHRRDADAAVVSVLEEIIPFLEKSRPSSPLSRSISVGESSQGAVVGTQTGDGPHVNTVGSAELQKDYDANSGNEKPFHIAVNCPNESFYEGEDDTAELTLSKKTRENRMSADVYSHGEPVVTIDQNGVNLQIEVLGNPSTEETSTGVKISQDTLVEEHDNQMMNIIQEREDSAGHLETGFVTAGNGGNNLENSCAVINDPDVDESNLQKSDVSLSTDPDSSQKTTRDNVETEGVSTLTASMSQSSQFHIVDVVEEIIADARNNKKTLFLAIESVISLMRQVEHKEQAAEQAKEEAAVGGNNILDKVEEIKRMLQHSKEANDMHAGEVYGEKAILATELRELQFRVLSLSNERDKSLADLDEMRQTLEVRLAAAETEIKCAEQEKLEKEEAARKSLVEQELIMEKVVQESKILKQQAEDNAKLQEFLVDRGRVVDMLQGEIAVICQDVRLLKEKFDDRVPFSQSLSSNQTSFILASSTSSSKSPNPDQEVETRPEEDDLWETQTKRDRDESSEEEAARDDRSTLINDGWELCEDLEIDS